MHKQCALRRRLWSTNKLLYMSELPDSGTMSPNRAAGLRLFVSPNAGRSFIMVFAPEEASDCCQSGRSAQASCWTLQNRVSKQRSWTLQNRVCCKHWRVFCYGVVTRGSFGAQSVRLPYSLKLCPSAVERLWDNVLAPEVAFEYGNSSPTVL